ncbi:MAG: hypothetical protein KF784_19270 [Fimbriimonadaceae bacterium]|nr:hypothetical protein [Fimbriimonadaceae bacterium]
MVTKENKAQSENAKCPHDPTNTQQQGTERGNRCTLSPSGKIAEPHSAPHQTGPQENKKHWLEYGFFIASFIAAIAGTFAAGFAGVQAWISNDTAKRQLRAYVSVDLAKIEDPACPGCVPSAVITFKNYGLTPAYRWQAWDGVMIGETFDEEHWNVTNPDALPQGGGTKGILGPGQTTRTEVRNKALRLTPHQVQELDDGRLTLFFFGYIRYWDAFDREQWTTYRYFYGGPVGLGKSFPQAPKGNDAS